jgi:tripartite-type tricarboxylate transporter receptor subunit TctC
MLVKLIAAFIAALAAAPAAAQQYPTKPVRIVVPFAPGGGSDFTARLIAQRLGERMGQTFLVENKPGAGGNLGAEQVVKAPADGYTLLSTAETTFAVNPYVYAQLPFDPAKDYVPVTGLGIVNQVLAVNPAMPYMSVADVIAAAKAQPGKLNYAAFGPGSSPHLNMEMFLHMAGVQMTPVHYKGGAPALTDVIGGHVPMIILSTTLTSKPYKAGQLRILGVGARERVAAFPEIPTIAESGLPGYEAVSWFGLFAPGATPRDVVAKINADVQRILADAEFREKFLAPNYFEPIMGSPEQFADYVKREANKWSEVIKHAHITLE